MDVLESPEIKRKYENSKLVVKMWETKFKKKFGRVPSKHDIKEADMDIRYAYKTYFNIKSAILEKSFKDVDGFHSDEEVKDTKQSQSDAPSANNLDTTLSFSQTFSSENIDTSNVPLASSTKIMEPVDTSNFNKFGEASTTLFAEDSSVLENINTEKTWGEHLNQGYKKPEEKKDHQIMNVNRSFTKKLFNGSKFSKRNPRKSLSFSHRKSESNFDNTRTFSQPDPDTSSSFIDLQSSCPEEIPDQQEVHKTKFKIVSASQPIHSKSLNVIQSVIENNYKPVIRNLDTGWIQRTAAKTGTELTDEDLAISSLITNDLVSKNTNGFPLNLPKNTTEKRISDSVVGTKVDDYDSEDIIEESDEEERSKSICHVSKKRRLDGVYNLSQSILSTQTNETSEPKKLDFSNIFDKTDVRENTLPALDPTVSKTFNIGASVNETIRSNVDSINNISEKPVVNKFDDVKELETNTEKQINIGAEHAKSNVESTETTLKQSKKQKTQKTQKITQSMKKVKPRQMKEAVKVDQTPIRKSARERKTIVTLEKESESENEDPFKSDNDSDDPEFNLSSENKKRFVPLEIISPPFIERKTRAPKTSKASKEPKTPKEPKAPKIPKERQTSKPRIQRTPRQQTSNTNTRGKKTNLLENNRQDSEEDKMYEMEFSIKPRIQTVPRVNNLKEILIKQKIKNPVKEEKDTQSTKLNVVKDKRQQAKEKLEKKIACGGLNDNFVQINLKKKVFVRGKKNMNFSKYKKQMWKDKKKALSGPNMDMGGCDGGMLTCFNCGKTGHFARHCKETKGDGLLPLEAHIEEECPYPTLEEASAMAKDPRFAIRKPTLNMEKSAEQSIKNKHSGGEGSSKNITENKTIDDTLSAEDEDGAVEDKHNVVDEEIKELDEDGILNDEMDEVDEEALFVETLRLEEYVRKLDVKQYLDSTTIVKPYYNLKEDGSIIDTPREVFDVLHMFGHTSFRPGQEQAIMRILSGKSTLVTLSTGSGKSLCYQLPAYLFAKREPCISLIISPLVSLMEDQVTGIPHLLRAACLHTNQTKPQREKIMEALNAGELSVLLISPEAVVAGEKSSGFGSLLRKLPPIAFACIDEAHCVSQWSHNFRPSYLMICRILRERLGVSTILGLTATATRATSDSIIDHLQIPDGRNGIINDRPLPNNLRLTVSKDGNRDTALLGLLVSEEFSKFRSIIIYCIRRDECERIASFLRTSLKTERNVPENVQNKKRKRMNVQAEPYHAGLSASRRRTIQKAFMSNDLRIVVATVAFGMGINKTDLRAVIHYNMPKNFESYVQEIGRAGRDGLPAHCHLFLDNQGRDESELMRHIHANSMDRYVIRKLLEKIFIPCSCKSICPKHEVAFSIEDTVQLLDIPEENISTLLCYLELHENRYIEVLSPAYTMCKVIAYGGPMQIRKAAKDCPPLAMALALHKNTDENILEFPVIDIASSIGWDSGICKHKLKNLEWTSVNNQPKRSSLTVQFSKLGFRLLAPGNLTGTQLDEALDSLYQKVVNQEKMSLLQLHALHTTLTLVSVPSYKSCIGSAPSEKELLLKEKTREYFESPKPLDLLPEIKPKPVNEEFVTANVRTLVCMYKDNVFTGRAVARIFHGIQSPNYPAVIWGRCKFWRAHMMDDFNTLCNIATKEILKLR